MENKRKDKIEIKKPIFNIIFSPYLSPSFPKGKAKMTKKKLKRK
jgi:hypothetical protein